MLATHAKQLCEQAGQAAAAPVPADAAPAAKGRAALLKALWRAHGACASQLIAGGGAADASGSDPWALLDLPGSAEEAADAELCRTSGLPLGRPLAVALGALWSACNCGVGPGGGRRHSPA